MKRPWLRRLVIGIAALLLVAVGIFGWAAASVQRSAIARAMWWRDADIGDQFRFPSRAIPNGGEAGPLPSGTQLDLSSIETPDGRSVDQQLQGTDTLAFLVADDDRLVAEQY
jgi:hypothetical protein